MGNGLCLCMYDNGSRERDGRYTLAFSLGTAAMLRRPCDCIRCQHSELYMSHAAPFFINGHSSVDWLVDPDHVIVPFLSFTIHLYICGLLCFLVVYAV